MKKVDVGYIYTLLLVGTSFIGANVLSIDIGISLSPFRILVLLFPIVYIGWTQKTKKRNNAGSYYLRFLYGWFLYSIMLLPIMVRDYAPYGRNMYFFCTGIIAAYMVGKYITKEKDYYRIFLLFELASIVFGVIGVYEIFTGNYLAFRPDNIYDENYAVLNALGIRTPAAGFTNPNDYGLFLLFSICVSSTLYHVRYSKFGRWISRFLVLFFIFLAISTQSRAALLGITLFLTVKFYFWYKKASKRSRLSAIIILLVISFYAISWMIANYDMYSSLVSSDFNEVDGSDKVRWNLIKSGFQIFINSLFLGVGIGNVEYYIQHYAAYDTNGVANLHNWWLEVLVSSGIFIFVWYIRVYLKKYKMFFRGLLLTVKESVWYYYLLFGVLSMSMFLIGSIASSSIFGIEWFWTMFPVIFSMPLNIIKND